MRNTDYAAKRGRFISDAGSPIHAVLSPELQKDGSLRLVKIGEENTDEIIASYYESTTLECVLARFANGDLSALNRYEPIYMDVTSAPKTLAEAQQKIINAEYAFNALPADVKESFGNNFNVWLSEAGSDPWLQKMNSILNNKNEAPQERAKSADVSEAKRVGDEPKEV